MAVNPPPTILVTDDEDHVRQFISLVLRQNGYEVVEAIHGQDALEKLRGQCFDLLITDLNMPEMDGLTLLEKCRQAYPETDMLMLTAYGTIETAVHAMQVGALDFCTKPFGIADLTEKVERCLDLHRARAEDAERTTVKALVSLNQLLVNQSGLDETLAGILDLVDQVFQPAHVCLRTFATREGAEDAAIARGDSSTCAHPDLTRLQVERLAQRPSPWVFRLKSGEGDAVQAGRTVTVPLVTDRELVGSLTLSRADDRPSYTSQDAELLLIFASQIALSTVASQHRERMLSALRDRDAHRRVAIDTLKEALGAFDHTTREHSQRVARYARILGQAAGLQPEHLEDLYVGALLHDIGKIGIENQYVAKQGSLTTEELDRVKLHPLMGAKILRDAPGLDLARSIILTHHERLDGNGYPRQLKGDEIPFEGRLVAVVDAYDSMTSDRPYRAALSIESAIKQLLEGAGEQLDADLVGMWVSLIRNGQVN